LYRNFGDHESLLAEHSVATWHGGGVRWYEFRLNKQRDPVLYQQSTYAPDGFYRWLASMGMDRKGNIGIGYSFGGDPNYTGQRFAARTASLTQRASSPSTNRSWPRGRRRRRTASDGGLHQHRRRPVGRLHLLVRWQLPEGRCDV
jgi:hypothetical protein